MRDVSFLRHKCRLGQSRKAFSQRNAHYEHEQHEQPQLGIDSIREVVDAVRSGNWQPAR
jgi:hypothetical protein